MDTSWVDPAGGIVLVGFGICLVIAIFRETRDWVSNVREAWRLRNHGQYGYTPRRRLRRH